jgi:hypothetical protein
VGEGETGGLTPVGRRVWVDGSGGREAVGLSVGLTSEVGLSVGFTSEVGLSVGFTSEVGLSVGLATKVGLSVGLTGGGFPWFGFPGVGQDSMVLVLVTVLYLTSVEVFVLKTVTYETTGLGGLVTKGGEVPEGSTVEDESTDETELEPIETLGLGEGSTVAGGWLELLDGPSYKLSCAWATATKKRVKKAT